MGHYLVYQCWILSRHRQGDIYWTNTMMNKVAAVGVAGLCLVGCAMADDGFSNANSAMAEAALELARQSSVTVFNWNSLLIIIGLKLLILAVAGFFGVGLFGGRSLSAEQPWVDQSEVMFMLAFLVSQGQEKYDCLNKVACLDDDKAHDLLTVSRMMIKGAKYIQPFIGYDVKHYESITNGIEDAIHHRRSGDSCDAAYTCEAIPSL